MKNVSKSVLIWYSPEEMYRLVTDVERYPEFLPWCDHGKVIEEDANGMVAEMGPQRTCGGTFGQPAAAERAVLAAGRRLAFRADRRWFPASLPGGIANGLWF